MTAPLGSLQQRVVDIMALTGDTVDNVPGCPGIGSKTAAKLINHFGSLDTLLLCAGWASAFNRGQTFDGNLTVRLRCLLLDNTDQILMSRELVRLDGVPKWAIERYAP